MRDRRQQSLPNSVPGRTRLATTITSIRLNLCNGVLPCYRGITLITYCDNVMVLESLSLR